MQLQRGIDQRILFERILEALPNAKKMARGYVLANCPFHDDREQSLLVFPDGFAKCMGECNTWFSNERLYDELQSPGFRPRPSFEPTSFDTFSLPKRLDKLTDFVYNSHRALTSTPGFKWTFEQRGIAECIERSMLGWADGWMVIPFFDEERKVIGAFARAGEGVQRVTGQRFTHPQGQDNLMYAPDWALLRDVSKPLAVVFGLIDALVVSRLRYPVVTATSGKDSFEPRWLNDWIGRIYVIPDRGEEDSAIKLAGRLGWRGEVLYLDYNADTKDPADYAKADVNRLKELNAQLGSRLGG